MAQRRGPPALLAMQELPIACEQITDLHRVRNRSTRQLPVKRERASRLQPTDAMPLTRWAKLLMLTEASASGIAILLVVARAVNILDSRRRAYREDRAVSSHLDDG